MEATSTSPMTINHEGQQMWLTREFLGNLTENPSNKDKNELKAYLKGKEYYSYKGVTYKVRQSYYYYN